MDFKNLLNDVISIAKLSGESIADIYHHSHKIKVDTKSDQSPQTEADRVAHHLIINKLKVYNFLILSEEAENLDKLKPKDDEFYWLIDPLDGTKEFINRTGEFTINIGLIKNHKPVLGVVYAPIKDICYYAAYGVGAFRIDQNKKAHIIQSNDSTSTKDKRTIVISRDQNVELLKNLLDALGPYELIKMGSAMKICLVADGTADLYPRLFPTHEWDTAAAQCVLSEAGGNIYDLQLKMPLEYNKKTLINPPFLAINNSNKEWLNFFSIK